VTVSEGHPSATTDPGDAPAFEAIQALPGFCSLIKRSPTLDGQLPLRAAQHCSPVFEGNEAGFQIVLAQPMALRRSRQGLKVDMTPPAFEQTQQQVRGAIDRLVEGGWLQRGGYWHRLLAEDALPIQRNRILLWTGFLVKPAPGVALRVGRAFNRNSRISVVEHAIVDRSGFTPLVLVIDGSSLGEQPVYIDEEIGCVLPVASRASLRLRSIRAAPQVVRAFEAFFDAHYFETKASKPTGKYRRMLRELAVPPAAACDAEIFYAGPNVHAVSTLRLFHDARGIARQAPAGVSLPFCTVGNVARNAADWDGLAFTSEKKDMAKATSALARDWRAAGGRTSGDAYEFLSAYSYPPARGEPYWLLQPWVFAVTPPGWSSVLDGLPASGADGMRGIIHTDQFHSVAMVYHLFTPGRLTIRPGAPLLRFFPIPRRLQSAGMRLLETAKPPPSI
jgi:hypothetical protein